MPKCFTCDTEKDESQFYLRPDTGKFRTICRPCDSQRNTAEHRTPDGYLADSYDRMVCRVEGRARSTASKRCYTGLSILTRTDFMLWARTNEEFWRLYRVWVISNYNYKLSPSVNRIDPRKGYDLGNLEWLTHSMNCSLRRSPSDAVLGRIYAAAA